MEAKDTVMSPKKLQLLGQQYEDDVPTCDFTHYALEKQAEISFKAGMEYGVKRGVDESLDVGKQLGRVEVVEAIEKYGVMYRGNPWWDKKLKKWGIK